jgi:hypothetical protein
VTTETTANRYPHERRASRRAGEVAAWIGLGVTIGLYVFFTIWWASGINLTVERNSKWIESNQQLPSKITNIETWVTQNQGLPASISKIESNFDHLSEKISDVGDQLGRLDQKLDNLLIDGAREKNNRK